MAARREVTTARRGAHARRRAVGGACAGRAAAASVRARSRHGSVAEGPGGAAAARRRDRAQVARRAQTRAPDRGGHRQTVGASAGRQGFRRGVLV